MLRSCLSAALAALLALAAVPAAALDVVYVMRHAQKEGNWRADHQGAVPISATAWDRLKPLTKKGAKCAASRAARLAKRAEIAAVYASESARTLATGAAVSGASGAPIVGDDGTKAPTAEWVEDLRQRHRDDYAILVVGHSNTVGDLVLAFKPDARECLAALELVKSNGQPGIEETQYGDLWVLTLDGQGCSSVSREPPLVLGRGRSNNCATD